MLKFFRTLRKKLIDQDNVRKAVGSYLKYAIGKILLVVIGILIAENLTPTLKPACRTGRGGFSRFELKTIYNYQTARWHPLGLGQAWA